MNNNNDVNYSMRHFTSLYRRIGSKTGVDNSLLGKIVFIGRRIVLIRIISWYDEVRKESNPMRKLLIMLEDTLVSESDREEIRKIAANRDVVITQDEAKVKAIGNDIEIAAGWVPRYLMNQFPNLCWFQQWGAGADWLMEYPDLAGRDYILTNMSGLHAIPISEHILAFMLSFSRDLPRAMRAQVKGKWVQHQEINVFELAGKTMVLVGVGAIGERTARVANDIGMRVLGIRKRPEIMVPGVEMMASPENLISLLPEGDFLVLTVPLTNETKGMVSEVELRVMKRSAYIINIGRGATIDEKNLIVALQNGWIAGAGLDVFEDEPLPEDSPLWRMDNVIITSHYSGMTPQYHERGLKIFKENLKRYVMGDEMENVVNKDAGY